VAAVKLPVPSVVKATVPVGSSCVPASVSVTTAVQIMGEPICAGLGPQISEVEVERWVISTVSLPLTAVVTSSLFTEPVLLTVAAAVKATLYVTVIDALAPGPRWARVQ
jgi:hypothetical protein